MGLINNSMEKIPSEVDIRWPKRSRPFIEPKYSQEPAPRAVHSGTFGGQTGPEGIFIRVFRFSFVIIIPPVFHTRLFIQRRRYVILAIDSITK
jgi:hypothetical protein